MKIMDLVTAVEEHPDLEGVSASKEGLVVRHTPSKIKTKLPFDAIDKAELDELISVLTCERDPNALTHMTRVVGYFSRTENWNASKIGELKDRHAGDYVIK